MNPYIYGSSDCVISDCEWCHGTGWEWVRVDDEAERDLCRNCNGKKRVPLQDQPDWEK